MSHLDDALLHEWLDGELGPSDDARIERHLESCPECAERLEAAARDRAAATELLTDLTAGPRVVTADAISDGPVSGVPEAQVTVPAAEDVPADRPGWGALAWAASIVLAVALGWFARPPQTSQAPPPAPGRAPVAEAESTVPVENPERRIVDADAPREVPAAAPLDDVPRAEPGASVADPTAAEPVAKSLIAAQEAPAPELRRDQAAAEAAANVAEAGRLFEQSVEGVTLAQTAEPADRRLADAERPTGQQARQRSARAAAPAAAPEAASFAIAAVPGVFEWLGREPLLPPGASLIRAELRPAHEVSGSLGAAPVVAMQIELADGRVATLLQQRVGADPAGGASATGSVGERGDDGSSRIIDGILVIAVGPDAEGLLDEIESRD